MSRLYNIIEGQVNNLLQLIMTDESGNVDWGFWNQYIKPTSIRLLINVIASILYLMLLMLLGLYLYNQGLHVLAPSVLQPIGYGKVYQQDPNPYYQLLVSLFALMMFS